MLNPIRSEDSPSAAEEANTPFVGNPRRIRRFIGVIAFVAFGINLVLAQVSVSDARGSDASAIQIIQVWTPHIYYAILITGVAVALYIYSRSLD